MRLGILGGCFNPIHAGHIHVAREAMRLLALEKVLFVVAAAPPHKPAHGLAPFSDRLQMVRLALEKHEAFEASDIEAERNGPSYTVDTLRELRRLHPDAELYFIIGADTIRELPTWREPGEVLRLAQIAVMFRTGFPFDDIGLLKKIADNKTIEQIRKNTFATEPVNVSSTEIRKRVSAGKEITALVPAAVAQYIRKHGIYKSQHGSNNKRLG
jgi:nicotinate-nucleotide adenylyltransferase